MERNVPKLRFPEFADAWEQRKLLGCIQKITDFRGRTPKKLGMDWSDSGYLALSALNVKDGYIDFSQDVHYGDQALYDKWMSGNELHKGQVLFTTEAPMGNVAQVPDNRQYILSQRTIAFDVQPQLITENFLATVLRTPAVFATLTALSSGGTAKGVSQKSLATVDITIPSNLNEQESLASMFFGIDNLITLHQSKCDAIKKYKAGMLQKVFPKDGADVPEIRFPGFTDAWEQRKLADCLSEITYGFTNPMSDTDNGPWKLTAKDIVNGKIDYTSARHTSQIEYDGLTDKSKPIIGDLLLTKDGTLGRTAIVDTENICINQSVALLRFNKKCSAQYAKTLLDTPMYQKQMLDDAGGGTIKHIYITKVDKMSIPVPSKKEQEQIVYFFDNLDKLITLHQRKVEKYKELKKGLLQQMFV